MMVVLNHFGRLGNDIGFGMTCFKFIPFVGWHIYLAGHILLQKSFPRDKLAIENRLREVTANPNRVWLVLLPEGDHFTLEKHSKAVNYALKMEKQPLMHHLTPRHKAFAVTHEALKKIGGYSIVNAHIAYERPPEFSYLLRGRKIKARIYLERHELDDVEPTFDGIYKLFQQQDQQHENFLKFRDFNENGKLEEVKAINVDADRRVLINFLIWTIIWSGVAMAMIYRAMANAYKAELENYSMTTVMAKMLLDVFDKMTIICRGAFI
jgi:hypothetical protein